MRIYVQMSREEVKEQVLLLVRSCTGTAHNHAQHARTVHTAIGVAALGDIKMDFERKAEGETGEDGVTWQPLSKEYLAYGRRFGEGEKSALKKAAGLGRGHSRGIGENKGLLNAAQKKRWQQVFGTRFARFVLSMPIGEAKARAAQIAWETVKREGAKTMLEVYGNRKVSILRDTGVLLSSLSPAEWTEGTEYEPEHENQIFDLATNGVTVGTNVPYAAVHQNGSKKQGIPARPFLPTGEIPRVWSEGWAAAGRRAIHRTLVRIFTGAA